MQNKYPELTDQFGRVHDYLRISLTERCNLRCFYCMPEEGIELRDRKEFMTNEELLQIAKTYTDMGVRKIRLTGGEPLIRKNIEHILRNLAKLPIELAITTNGVLVHRFIDLFKELGINAVNVSLDSLKEERLNKITRKNYYKQIINNIYKLLENDFKVKVNMVVMKGVNDDEVSDFVELTKENNLQVRFIEFMPFQGNNWERSKAISFKETKDSITEHYTAAQIVKLEDQPNDTTKAYEIENYLGTFSFITSITNPFCGGCNRIRLTADGKIKNCLFSNKEVDLLSALRDNQDIRPLIVQNIQAKKKVRAGLNSSDDFNNIENHLRNRSMVSIGG